MAVAHDVVRDQSLPWRKDVSRREVASVEEGHDVERVAETMRVTYCAEEGELAMHAVSEGW